MDTSYQAHGKSEDRVREALKKPCCQRKCKRAIAFRLAMQLCVAFWSLSKGGQDSLPLGHGLSSVSNLIHQRNFQNKSMMFVIVLMNSEGYGACRIRILTESDDDSRESDAGSSCSKSSTSSSESESINRKSSWFLQGNSTWTYSIGFSPQHPNPHRTYWFQATLVQLRHTSVQRGMAPDPWNWAWPTISLQEEFQRCWPSEPGALEPSLFAHFSALKPVRF